MKLQKKYRPEAYLLGKQCRPSIKAIRGLWHLLNTNNYKTVLWQVCMIAPIVAERTPSQYIFGLQQLVGLLRRDIRGIRVQIAREIGEKGNSQKLAAKYRISPFAFEN
jgi:hypothetical protein